MIFLRNISVADCEILAQIHQESFSEAWSKDSFKSMLLDPSFFGFIVGQELKEQGSSKKQTIECGFILARKVLNEIEVITFCVLPEYRRKNFGKLLMVELIKQAGVFLNEEFQQNKSENLKIFLEVAENNTAAIRLYDSFGFSKISKRSQYYSNQKGEKVDANIMSLVLAVEGE